MSKRKQKNADGRSNPNVNFKAELIEDRQKLQDRLEE